MVELIICEKPSAAQKVAQALADTKPTKKSNNKVSYYELKHKGKKIFVASAVGHLYNLAEKKKKGWTYPVFEIEWRAAYDISKDQDYVRGYVTTLKKLAKQADKFTLACDYDVEGELIGLNALRFACNKKDGSRMKFSTLTKSDLEEAYEKKSKHIDWGQAHAGETRHMLDWYYGINLSRALTASIKAADSFKIMSIGRVQGPALKMLVEREKEIQKFKAVPFWQLQLFGAAGKKPFEAWHVEDKFWDKKQVSSIHKKVKSEKKATVTKVKKTQKKQQAPYPFDLTTLQTESYGHHGISPKETLAIAQKLYVAGYLSYPRTSSQQLSPKLGFQKILKQLQKQKEYEKLAGDLLKQKTLTPNNGKKTDPAHPAIYPTGHVPKGISARDRKVYDLVVKRFLATFGPDAVRESLALHLDVKKEDFKANGSRTVEPGWHVFYQPYVRAKDVELPEVNEGDVLTVKKIDLLDKETQPPKRYTQSSVIKELEKRHLGTKATRADIVDTLFKRGYAAGKQVMATELGIQMVDTLHEHSPRILDEEMTQTFEEHMVKIREGKEKPAKVLEKAIKVLKPILKDFKDHEKDIGKQLIDATREADRIANTTVPCPICKKEGRKGGMMMIKRSRFGRFLGCSTHPKCTFTYKIPRKGDVKASGKFDEKTGQELLSVRPGRIPKLVNIDPNSKENKAEEKLMHDTHIPGVNEKCPNCAEGVFVMRKSFYGVFLGCNGYPKCKTMRSLKKNDAGKYELGEVISRNKKDDGKKKVTKKKAVKKKVTKKKTTKKKTSTTKKKSGKKTTKKKS